MQRLPSGLSRTGLLAVSVLCALGWSSAAVAQAERKRASYGEWASSISAARVAQASTAIADITVAAGKAYWVESRPTEGARYVVVTLDAAGALRELTPPAFSARTRVHEYGGTPYVVRGDTLYFSNWSDQRLYAQKAGSMPAPLTPAGYRYADCTVDPSGPRLFCVREDHSSPGEPRNAIVAVSLEQGGAGAVLFEASDFVAYPRVSADGHRLAWISWNHPDMPFDGTTLHVGDLDGGALARGVVVAGSRTESVVEPAWDRDGTLYFMSDRSGWWNLYRWDGRRVRPVVALEAEFATPLWRLGQANSPSRVTAGRCSVTACKRAIDSRCSI